MGGSLRLVGRHAAAQERKGAGEPSVSGGAAAVRCKERRREGLVRLPACLPLLSLLGLLVFCPTTSEWEGERKDERGVTAGAGRRLARRGLLASGVRVPAPIAAHAAQALVGLPQTGAPAAALVVGLWEAPACRSKTAKGDSVGGRLCGCRQRVYGGRVGARGHQPGKLLVFGTWRCLASEALGSA